jgi:hypothetical protein
VVRGNRRLTLREYAEEVGIIIGSCHLIFTEKLLTRLVSAKFVPRLLTDDQKENRYLAKHQTPVVPHPPYSPDLAPAGFFPFPRLKTTLKGRRFQTIEEIQENAIRELRAITESAFQEAFQQWKKRWERLSPVDGTALTVL